MQGYNAQAVANEQQIVLAAEITVDSPDFGHLGPMIQATERELDNVGIAERPEVIVADAGYWHQEQMDEIVSRGMQVLIPPDAKKRKGAAPGGPAAPTPGCAPSWPTSPAMGSTTAGR